MKVLLINGSPDRKGCISTAFEVLEEEFAREGVEAAQFQVGASVVSCRRGGNSASFELALIAGICLCALGMWHIWPVKNFYCDKFAGRYSCQQQLLI